MTWGSLFELRPIQLTSLAYGLAFEGFELLQGGQVVYRKLPVPSGVIQFVPGRLFPVLFCPDTPPQELQPETVSCTEELGSREPELIVVGGSERRASLERRTQRSEAETYAYNFRLDAWRTLAPPMHARRDHALATNDDATEIFCLGGLRDDPLAECERYSVAGNFWTRMAPLLRPRCRGSAVALGKSVIVLGGSDWNRNLLTAEVWDGAHWQHGQGLLEDRISCGLAVIGNELFICGGQTPAGGACVASMEIAVVPNVARRGPPMGRPRSNFGIAVVAGRIYVMGGLAHTDIGVRPNKSVERYDPNTNSWEHCRSLPEALFAFSTAVEGSRIYVIGGNNGYHAVATVFIYDTLTDTWVNGTPLPQAREAHRSVVVWTPRALAGLL